MAKNGIAAFLNFIVWGLGYIYKGKSGFGLVWIIAYIFAHLPIYFLGWEYAFTEMAGILTFTSHIIISILLAYDVYK